MMIRTKHGMIRKFLTGRIWGAALGRRATKKWAVAITTRSGFGGA